MDEILEEQNAPQETPQIVKFLAIFSYIGNGLWGLFLLLMIATLSSYESMFSGLLPGGAGSSEMASFMMMIKVILGLFIVTCIVSIIGTVKMGQGKRSGFFMYAIANGIWGLLFAYSGVTGGGMEALVIGLASIGFIVGFGSQLKSFT